MSAAIQGPQEGAMLPDFTLHFCDGRMLQRRELKGRSHAAIYFPPARPLQEEKAVLASIAAWVPRWRAARAAVLVIVSAENAAATASWPFESAIDRDGIVRARFGVGPGGALFVADRYGEIAFRADGAVDPSGVPSALPLDKVAPILDLLEVRCSL